MVLLAAEVRVIALSYERFIAALRPANFSFPVGTAGAFLEEQPGSEADHLPPLSKAKVKDVWSCTSTPHMLPWRALGKRHL